MTEFYRVIDNFLDEEIAEKISKEFPDYDSDAWYGYDNVVENKKINMSWYRLPETTYQTFSHFCSPSFVKNIQEMMGTGTLYPDYGLHGGGFHIHRRGGKLNLHRDYSMHPKLKLRRKVNLIIFLSKNWDSSWGGSLELWTNDFEKNQPKDKLIEIECVFNRAVIFDTTEPYWHGLPTPLECPDGVYRKTLAMYYLDEPEERTEKRYRALFAPSEIQKGDQDILEFIQKRCTHE
jgi:Rps23 Pro-64 3,4-dihydroxylase Tpa1-like proline 4-hydroxylase|tara:strand:+ start:485 stop:1186 length:702 start_codon:yes stop_codon:yes gene_type:complete